MVGQTELDHHDPWHLWVVGHQSASYNDRRNYHTRPGLAMLIGTVGSDKSTFLKTIIGEIPEQVNALSPKVTYADQSTNASIRGNIGTENGHALNLGYWLGILGCSVSELLIGLPRSIRIFTPDALFIPSVAKKSSVPWGKLFFIKVMDKVSSIVVSTDRDWTV